jgi:adenylate cyclase
MRFRQDLAIYTGSAAGITIAFVTCLDPWLNHIPVDPIGLTFKLIGVVAATAIAWYVIQKSRLLISKGIQIEVEKDRVKQAFSRYVSKDVAEEILKGELFPRIGERRQVTVLFSDIRGFTQMSETMPAEEVVILLNDYFSEMVEAVFAEGGTVDKYIGDGLMALFGAPVSQLDHADRATKAALRMRQGLSRINNRRMSQGKPPLKIGIGIHTGECIIGNIGAEQRLDYTAIGDTVNTASRIESLTKEYGVDIVLSSQTRALLGPQTETKILAPARVKGKTAPLEVYHLLATP